MRYSDGELFSISSRDIGTEFGTCLINNNFAHQGAIIYIRTYISMSPYNYLLGQRKNSTEHDELENTFDQHPTNNTN